MAKNAHEDLTTATAALDKADITSQSPAPGSYPPISSIPRISPERLAQAAEDAPSDEANAANTILYLAYGSNMCAKTFLGARKVRPLAQENVSVPILRLTFDLPGLPYIEPCFANVGYRKIPEKPKLPDPLHPPIVPPIGPPKPGSGWDDGLIGVVYEVTVSDWNNIMRTEGGGSSYQEIIVPCLPLPADVGIPEKPFPSLPKPFLAKTLYAPYIPLEEHRLKGPTAGPRRPTPDNAQASARYLNLLKDGAKEHDLPPAYQEYLASLQPYTITSWRQRIGSILFVMCWALPLILILVASRILGDDTGRVPGWMKIVVASLFKAMWRSHDVFFKPIFGDGERTEEPDKEKMKVKARRMSRRMSHGIGTDEEKASLMQADEEKD